MLQESLVRKIANCIWRGRRIVTAETAHIIKSLESIPDDLEELDDQKDITRLITGIEPYQRTADETEDLLFAIAQARSVPSYESARHLLYYEMRIDRQLSRTYRLFRQLKHSALLDKAIADLNPPISESPAPASPDDTIAANHLTPDNLPESAPRPPDPATPSAESNIGSPVLDETNPLTPCPPTS